MKYWQIQMLVFVEMGFTIRIHTSLGVVLGMGYGGAGLVPDMALAYSATALGWEKSTVIFTVTDMETGWATVRRSRTQILTPFISSNMDILPDGLGFGLDFGGAGGNGNGYGYGEIYCYGFSDGTGHGDGLGEASGGYQQGVAGYMSDYPDFLILR